VATNTWQTTLNYLLTYISRFLLVSLNVDAILKETTIYRRRQKLSAMTDGLGLGDAYGATLNRIKGQGGEMSRLGMEALMWISHSERPLKPDELCHALAIDIGSENLNTDNVPSIGTLLFCCQGLVVVDKKSSTVRLIHFTLQEYLRAHLALFGITHSTIAETCLRYLNSQQVKALSTVPSPDLRSTPFLEYSSVYWGTHAKRDLSECGKLLALKLFDDCSNQIPTKILLEAQWYYSPTIDSAKLSLFGGLHYASFFGIVEIVVGFLEVESYDINQEDCIGNTPLGWAAYNGHEDVVEIPLGRNDISPDKLDMLGQTPLCCAAQNGHHMVVKMLLGRDDVDADKPDNDGQTPLCCAAQDGREGVVKMLLGRDDVDPNKQDNHGQTPLYCAVRNGHEGVVKMLLRRDDVDPDKPGTDGKTPLCCAAQVGREGVVKMLLGRDGVDLNQQDNNGRTPLCCAVRREHEGVVKMLLGRDDMNPNEPDGDGRTPLSYAAWNGHEGVVKMLFGRDDINPNKPTSTGLTPLSYAAWNGHEGVVKILLERVDVDASRLDMDGQTPLCCAAQDGREGVVKMLLGWDDVDPNNKITTAEHHSAVLLGVGMREW